MENHRESRKRLRPWLERMINSGDCPGLVWENVEERTFRIPWRHFNNKEWVEADSKIFREWAKYTGKYQDGDKVEYPVWKTRLRCALKKIPEIKEIPEMHHIEDANPYRVYKFVDVPIMKRNCDFDTDSNHSQGSTISHRDILDEQPSPSPPNFLVAKFKGAEKPGNVPTVVFDEDSAMPLYARPIKQSPQNFLYYQLETPGIEHYCEKLECPTDTAHNYNIEPSLSSSEPMTTSLPSDLKSVNTDDLCLLAAIDLPHSINSITNHSMEAQPQSVNSTAAVTSSNATLQQFLPSMKMEVFYGAPSTLVMYETVQSPGCRFFSPYSRQVRESSLIEENVQIGLFGPKNVYQIALPSVERYLPENVNLEQRRLISDLLEKMERGIVITYSDSSDSPDIYVQRLCRTRVYLTDGATESVQLDRKGNSLTKAFDFKKFCTEYQEYLQGQRKDSPKPFFILTVGQEIKKSHFNPMGNILIYIVVKHDMATKIVSQDQNANSHSSGAFYSYDSYDKFLEEFKKVAT